MKDKKIIKLIDESGILDTLIANYGLFGRNSIEIFRLGMKHGKKKEKLIPIPNEMAEFILGLDTTKARIHYCDSILEESIKEHDEQLKICRDVTHYDDFPKNCYFGIPICKVEVPTDKKEPTPIHEKGGVVPKCKTNKAGGHKDNPEWCSWAKECTFIKFNKHACTFTHIKCEYNKREKVCDC